MLTLSGLRNAYWKFKRIVTPRPVRCVLRDGSIMKLDPRDEFEWHIYRARGYEPATLNLIDQVLRPGDVAIDVGANLGLMSLRAGRRVGPSGLVLAFEPHGTLFRRLQEHIAINGLPAIRAFDVALGEKDEARALYEVPDVSIGRGSLIDPGVHGRPVGEVRVRRLDSIVSGLGIKSVRMIKIDVEGFEYQVLKGATETLRMQPVICMELDQLLPTENCSPLDAHDFIMSLGGYGCYRFSRTKFAISPLVRVESREELATVSDNLIYVPDSKRSDLPESLFVAEA